MDSALAEGAPGVHDGGNRLVDLVMFDLDDLFDTAGFLEAGIPYFKLEEV